MTTPTPGYDLNDRLPGIRRAGEDRQRIDTFRQLMRRSNGLGLPDDITRKIEGYDPIFEPLQYYRINMTRNGIQGVYIAKFFNKYKEGYLFDFDLPHIDQPFPQPYNPIVSENEINEIEKVDFNQIAADARNKIDTLVPGRQYIVTLKRNNPYRITHPNLFQHHDQQHYIGLYERTDGAFGEDKTLIFMNYAPYQTWLQIDGKYIVNIEDIAEANFGGRRRRTKSKSSRRTKSISSRRTKLRRSRSRSKH
jgi:hypothetical protein